MGPALPRASDEDPKVYNRVRVLREERGLSRQELADRLGIGYRTLSYIEREDYTPSLPLAWRISGFFGVPTDEVFSPEPLRPMSELLFGGSSNEERA